MSVSQKSFASQQPHDFIASNNLTQNGSNPPFLLQLPIEVVQLIGKFSATGNSVMKSSENGVIFGRVCAFTHLVTHLDDEIDAIISLHPAIEEAIDYTRDRQVIGGDSGVPESPEEIIIREKQINLCRTFYNIFKKTIGPVNAKDLAEFIHRTRNLFELIKYRCRCDKGDSVPAEKENTQMLQKSNLLLYTLCDEIIKDVFLCCADDLLTKEEFENKVREIREKLAYAENFFTYPIVDSDWAFQFAFVAGLHEAIDPTGPKLKNYILKIEQEIKALENELRVLRGPNHFDGKINETFQQKLSAQANGEIEKATSLGKLFDELMDRLHQIATFDDSGEIVGGRLAELYAILKKNPIDISMTDAELQKRIISFKRFLGFLGVNL